MVKRVDVAVFAAGARHGRAEAPSGTSSSGLNDGGVGLTDFHYTRGVDRRRTIWRSSRAFARAIIAGTIVPPSTREELAQFKPVPDY